MFSWLKPRDDQTLFATELRQCDKNKYKREGMSETEKEKKKKRFSFSPSGANLGGPGSALSGSSQLENL